MCIIGLPPRYRSYLLRFWETRGLTLGAPVQWRFSLEDPRTGEKHGFADLAALVAFLQEQTGRGETTRDEAQGQERR
jgi:hypothetical protein